MKNSLSEFSQVVIYVLAQQVLKNLFKLNADNYLS